MEPVQVRHLHHVCIYTSRTEGGRGSLEDDGFASDSQINFTTLGIFC